MAKSTPEVTKVTMTDGREVEFTGKRRLEKVGIENPDGTLAVRLDWRNGETRTFQLPMDLLPKFAMHGALQKLGDESSGVDDIEDAVEVTDQLIGRLEVGEWRVTSEGGSGMAGASILARALVEVTGQPIAAVRQYLGTQSNKVKLALRASAEVMPVIQRLEKEKAERAAARGKTTTAGPSVDTEAALAGLRALSGTPA